MPQGRFSAQGVLAPLFRPRVKENSCGQKALHGTNQQGKLVEKGDEGSQELGRVFSSQLAKRGEKKRKLNVITALSTLCPLRWLQAQFTPSICLEVTFFLDPQFTIIMTLWRTPLATYPPHAPHHGPF